MLRLLAKVIGYFWRRVDEASEGGWRADEGDPIHLGPTRDAHACGSRGCVRDTRPRPEQGRLTLLRMRGVSTSPPTRRGWPRRGVPGPSGGPPCLPEHGAASPPLSW